MRLGWYPDVRAVNSPEAISLDDLRALVREDRSIQLKTEGVRTARRHGRDGEADRIKLGLPAFTVALFGACHDRCRATNPCSGAEPHRARTADVLEHAGVVPMDLDHVADMGDVYEALQLQPWVAWMYRTASGDGIRVLVAIDPIDVSLGHEHVYRAHASAWASAADAIEEAVGHRADKLSDHTRLNFLSADEDEWCRPSPRPLAWEMREDALAERSTVAAVPAGEAAEWMVRYWGGDRWRSEVAKALGHIDLANRTANGEALSPSLRVAGRHPRVWGSACRLYQWVHAGVVSHEEWEVAVGLLYDASAGSDDAASMRRVYENAPRSWIGQKGLPPPPYGWMKEKGYVRERHGPRGRVVRPEVDAW